MKKLFFACVVLSFIMFSCTESVIIEPIDQEPMAENLLPTEFKALFNIFDGAGLGAAVNLSDDVLLLFSKDGQEYAWFEDREIKRTGRLDEQGGQFENLAFSAIGAANPFNDDQIALFNTVGGTYQWLRFDSEMIKGNSSNNNLFELDNGTSSLWEWGNDNSCPFDKVGAVMPFSKTPEGCTSIGDDDDFIWMLNVDGDKLTRYKKETSDFDEIVELEQWRSQNVCGGFPAIFPINTIGAACVFEEDGQDSQELFFTREGTEMVVLNGTRGIVSDVFSLK